MENNIEQVLAPKVSKAQLDFFKAQLLKQVMDLATIYRVSPEVTKAKVDTITAINFEEICKDKIEADAVEEFNVHLREIQELFKQLMKTLPVTLQAEAFRDIIYNENGRFNNQHDRDLLLSLLMVGLETRYIMCEIHAELVGQRKDSKDHLLKLENVFNMFGRAAEQVVAPKN